MPNWFVYDWQVRGEPALFSVDVSYGEAPEGPPFGAYSLLAYCAIAPPEKGRAFTTQEESRILRIEKKLLKLLPDSCYAGQIHMRALHQFYFYIPEADADFADEALDALAYKQKRLYLHHGLTPEGDWLTYRELLYPDAAKFQTELNAQLIEQQRKLGDALDKVRRITLLFGFLSEPEKLLFREAIRQAGFAIGEEDFLPDQQRPHMLSVYVLSALSKPEIDSITTRAIRIAAPYHGELLRWITPKLAKRSPLA